ncbi:polyphosphate kinase [Hyaloraphidium curvatum]|nr:polyphosphate kinase [Hyaloraphidium curvatum]
MSAGDANTSGRHTADADLGTVVYAVNGANGVSPDSAATNHSHSDAERPESPLTAALRRPPILEKTRTWSRDKPHPDPRSPNTYVPTDPELPPEGITPSLSAQEFTQMLIEDQQATTVLPVLPGALLDPDADAAGDPDEISDKLSERRGEMPDPKDLVNRELSWIEFNKRVLAMAERTDLPLLERFKFLAIFSSNLDEFFEVRVGRLNAMERDIPHLLSQESLTPSEQLARIREKLPPIVNHQIEIFKELLEELAREHVTLKKWDELNNAEKAALKDYFETEVMDTLTPLSVDSSHPFAYVSNLSLNIGFSILDPVTSQEKFARVKVPTSTRLINLTQLLDPKQAGPDQPVVLVPMEELIYGNAQELFRGMKIIGRCVFRLTRHADLGLYGDIEGDLREVIELQTKKHKRAEPAVRLELDFPDQHRKKKKHSKDAELHKKSRRSKADVDDEEEEPDEQEKVTQLLTNRMKIKREDVYINDWGLMDLTCLWALMKLNRPHLKSTNYAPRIPKILDFDHMAAPHRFFDILSKKGDIMVHLPYESFPASVEAFVESASLDPHVMAIKMTLYRTSDGENPLIQALIRAAESGKQVVVLLELKARFNEMSNVNWSRRLEQAGVHVVYGVEGLKTHAKITLVIRKEGKSTKRYVHASTGNYNRKTAGIYEDLSFFTSDQRIGEDAVDLFNYLTGYSRFQDYNSLIVAPLLMRNKLMELIEEQAAKGDDGQIFIKCNSITDPGIIGALYRASQAGCWIDIVVRGVCCLKPGVEGLSKNIRVRSIIGKYLEHSRIYKFGDGEDTKVYIASADLMHRNISRRCEILVPITSPRQRARLDEIVRACLYDEHLAWELQGETWSYVNGDPEKNTHTIFEKVYEHLVQTKTARKKRLLFVDED